MANKFQKSVLERLEMERKKNRTAVVEVQMEDTDAEISYTTYGVHVEAEDGTVTTIPDIATDEAAVQRLAESLTDVDGEQIGEVVEDFLMDPQSFRPKMKVAEEEQAKPAPPAAVQDDPPKETYENHLGLTPKIQPDGRELFDAQEVFQALMNQSSNALEEEEEPDSPAKYLRVTPTRQAKNKTFYLDADVIQGVRAASKKAGVADSKLVNDILRAVLGLKD